jgi:hypothetical protein
MGEAEGLRHQDRVRVGTRPYLTKHGHDRSVLAQAVISFRRQPGTDPKRKRSMRVKQRKDLLQAGF